MQKTIKFETDSIGQSIAILPLGPEGNKGNAILCRDDLLFLHSLGLSIKWNRLSKIGYVTAPCAFVRGGHLLPARVLLNAGPRQTVRYKDGDPTNLRRSNLSLEEGGWAKRRDRDYLRPERRRSNAGIAA